jgi:predicted metal-binding membrane protein
MAKTLSMLLSRSSVVPTPASLPPQALSRPVVGVAFVLSVLIFAGWSVLIAASINADNGPGLMAVCRPLGLAGLAYGERFGLGFGLWIAMVFAMMLPGASHMMLGFAARARRAQGHVLMRLLCLLLGYCAVWFWFSALAAFAQLSLADALGKAALPERALGILAGTTIGFAGLYQFTPLKRASLAACRHGFADHVILPVTRRGWGRLGLQQGLYCLSCCAAMMGIMLVAGTMNLFWMLVFAIIMGLEKLCVSDILPKLIGVGLLVSGAALALVSVGTRTVLLYFGLR